MRRILPLLALLAVGSALAAPLFEFRPGEAGWFVRNDAVMGGVSSSRTLVQGGVLEFAGRVRLENGGGFAGTRSRPVRLNLSEYSSLVLRVRGDGKRYALQLGSRSAPRVTYRAFFTAPAGRWAEVRVPLRSFRPTRSGEMLAGPALDPSRVFFVGITYGNNRAERFRLEVDWMRGE